MLHFCWILNFCWIIIFCWMLKSSIIKKLSLSVAFSLYWILLYFAYHRRLNRDSCNATEDWKYYWHFVRFATKPDTKTYFPLVHQRKLKCKTPVTQRKTKHAEKDKRLLKGRQNASDFGMTKSINGIYNIHIYNICWPITGYAIRISLENHDLCLYSKIGNLPVLWHSLRTPFKNPDFSKSSRFYQSIITENEHHV